MIIRRAFFPWQFIAAAALPIWLLVGWGIFGGSGWGLLGLIVVCPVAFIALLAVAALIAARKKVRVSRSVSWRDVAALSAWHLSIIGIGFYGLWGTWFGIAAIVLGIYAFWQSVWELVAETRARVSATFESIQAEAMRASVPRSSFRATPPHNPPDQETIVVVEAKNATAGPKADAPGDSRN